MIYSKETARQTALYLLQIKAIKLNNTTPFQWASGWKAPIYCDNRKTLSYPAIRRYLRAQFIHIIRKEYAGATVVAGVATGGIAMGALVAEGLELPFVYVRSAQKGHGMQNKIEGVLRDGDKAVVIEDLVSTGRSSLTAVRALKDSGVKVLGMISIFDYGFDTAVQNFLDEQCDLLSLADYDTLLTHAHYEGYITSRELGSLGYWRKAPEKWGVDQ